MRRCWQIYLVLIGLTGTACGQFTPELYQGFSPWNISTNFLARAKFHTETTESGSITYLTDIYPAESVSDAVFSTWSGSAEGNVWVPIETNLFLRGVRMRDYELYQACVERWQVLNPTNDVSELDDGYKPRFYFDTVSNEKSVKAFIADHAGSFVDLTEVDAYGYFDTYFETPTAYVWSTNDGWTLTGGYPESMPKWDAGEMAATSGVPHLYMTNLVTNTTAYGWQVGDYDTYIVSNATITNITIDVSWYDYTPTWLGEPYVSTSSVIVDGQAVLIVTTNENIQIGYSSSDYRQPAFYTNVLSKMVWIAKTPTVSNELWHGSWCTNTATDGSDWTNAGPTSVAWPYAYKLAFSNEVQEPDGDWYDNPCDDVEGCMMPFTKITFPEPVYMIYRYHSYGGGGNYESCTEAALDAAATVAGEFGFMSVIGYAACATNHYVGWELQACGEANVYFGTSAEKREPIAFITCTEIEEIIVCNDVNATHQYHYARARGLLEVTNLYAELTYELDEYYQTINIFTNALPDYEANITGTWTDRKGLYARQTSQTGGYSYRSDFDVTNKPWASDTIEQKSWLIEDAEWLIKYDVSGGFKYR